MMYKDEDDDIYIIPLLENDDAQDILEAECKICNINIEVINRLIDIEYRAKEKSYGIYDAIKEVLESY